MEELIYQKIREYDTEMERFEISFTDRSLPLDDLISLYKFRNDMARMFFFSEDYSTIFSDHQF
jgi:hypothetical protein